MFDDTTPDGDVKDQPDPGDEDGAPEPQVDPDTPPLDLDDDGDPDEPTAELPSVDEAYAAEQQVVSPGLDGSPFAHKDQGPTIE